MLNKLRQISVTLIIVVISSIFVDEGMTIMLIGESIQIHLKHAHHNDLELPHQHNHIKHADDEKLVNTYKPELKSPDKQFFTSSADFSILPQDFSGLIWQPPKSL
jgi:hypothetical protein